MSYDYSKLRGRIIEIFGDQKAFAAAMGMGESTLSLKMCNKNTWKQNEITRAMACLGLKDDEVHAYFFNLSVQRQ